MGGWPAFILNLGTGGGTTPPPATPDDLIEALRARFAACPGLDAVTGFYGYSVEGRPDLPVLVVNSVRETGFPLTFSPTYPAAAEIQVTVLDDDPARGKRLRDAAFLELAPRVRPALVFADGADGGGRIPGMRWEFRQPGVGRGGSPVWACVFGYQLQITRAWPT